VLQGACETLRRWRPVVLCEVSDVLLSKRGACSRDVFRLLEDYDYKVVHATEPTQEVVSPFVGEVLVVPRRETGQSQAGS
jgi:hypothetical protein